MTDNKSTDTNNNNNEWKERDIGALWKREGKSMATYTMAMGYHES